MALHNCGTDTVYMTHTPQANVQTMAIQRGLQYQGFNKGRALPRTLPFIVLNLALSGV